MQRNCVCTRVSPARMPRPGEENPRSHLPLGPRPLHPSIRSGSACPGTPCPPATLMVAAPAILTPPAPWHACRPIRRAPRCPRTAIPTLLPLISRRPALSRPASRPLKAPLAQDIPPHLQGAPGSLRSRPAGRRRLARAQPRGCVAAASAARLPLAAAVRSGSPARAARG